MGETRRVSKKNGFGGSPGQDLSRAGDTLGPGRAYLPVLQVLHSHEQAARDVKELPAQTIWGQTQGAAVREAQTGESRRAHWGSPQHSRFPGHWWPGRLPKPARTSHPGQLPGNQDRVGGTLGQRWPQLPSGVCSRWVAGPAHRDMFMMAEKWDRSQGAAANMARACKGT